MLEAARDLYALPPGDFTASRNQLAKSLKAAGDAEGAAVIAKLRRPRLAEWALNQLARTQPEIVARLAAAIHAAQEAQSAAIGGDAAGLRSATTELRQAVGATADAAVRLLSADGGNGEGQRDDLNSIIRDLVSSAEPAPLVAGVIGSEALVTPDDLFPGAPDPAPSRVKSAPAATPAAAAAPRDAPPAKVHSPHLTVVPKPKPNPATAAAQRAMVRAERLRLQQELRAAETAQSKATAAVDEATAELARRKTALKDATAATRAAAAALEAFDGAD
ncbi:MAG: hypothetical protein JWN62_2888 [Acidimicrobiales bacterium]|nr:hypothetical protein [Acidimicrobiales bacterium]